MIAAHNADKGVKIHPSGRRSTIIAATDACPLGKLSLSFIYGDGLHRPTIAFTKPIVTSSIANVTALRKSAAEIIMHKHVAIK